MTKKTQGGSGLSERPVYVPQDIYDEYLTRKALVRPEQPEYTESVALLEKLIFTPSMERVWRRLDCSGEWLYQAIQNARYHIEDLGLQPKHTKSEWRNRNKEAAMHARKLASMVETYFGSTLYPWPEEFRAFATLMDERAHIDPPSTVGQPKRPDATVTAFLRHLSESLQSGLSMNGKRIQHDRRDIATLANIALSRRDLDEIRPEEVRERLRARR